MTPEVTCPVCAHSTDNKGTKLVLDGKAPENHPGQVPAKCPKCSFSTMIYSAPTGFYPTLREATDASAGKETPESDPTKAEKPTPRRSHHKAEE